jgi:hypothetical protein
MEKNEPAGAQTIKSIQRLTPVPAGFSLASTVLCYRSALVSLVICDQLPQPICADV